jgi:4'-phosphopantetheinyl transferase
VSGACEVWWARPVDPGSAPGLRALLDDAERDRLPRFRRAADRARYLAAHALTRIVVAGAVGAAPGALRFDRTCRCGEQHGKPTLPGGPGFSLTHAGDPVGVAVHDRPVGLDVERARPLSDLAAMAEHVRAPGETVADAEAFFALWTRKEAVLKATGDGLSTPMSSITLGPTGVDWTGAGAPTDPIWLHDLHPAEGYPAAVAGLGPAPAAVRESDGDALLRALVA